MGAIIDGLDETKIKYVEIDGIRTRYYEDGAGEPLVLIHGGEYSSYYSLDGWSLNLPELARSFHVYALDKLGHGHTDNPSADDYTFAALARHTEGFFRALGIRQAHCAGHSRGGLSVTYLAYQHPDLVKTAILVDSGSTAPEDPRYPSGAFYAEVRRRVPPGAPVRDVVRAEPDAQAFNPDQVTEDFVDRLCRIADLPKVREARRRMREIGPDVWYPSLEQARQQVWQRIEEEGMPVPTLLVWGYNDRAAPFPVGLTLFEKVSAKTDRAELHVLRGAGHYCFRDQSAAFNRLLRSLCLG